MNNVYINIEKIRRLRYLTKLDIRHDVSFLVTFNEIHIDLYHLDDLLKAAYKKEYNSSISEFILQKFGKEVHQLIEELI